MKKEITQKELKELLHYDPNTGVFIWVKKQSNKILAGHIARSCNNRGYAQISIYGKSYKAHRLAWLYKYGEMPKNQIDHRNQNRADNRLRNLREVTNRENCRNQSAPKNNTSSVVGVAWHKRDLIWEASIGVDFKNIYLGRFKRKKDAIHARKQAERLYGFDKNHGRHK